MDLGESLHEIELAQLEYDCERFYGRSMDSMHRSVALANTTDECFRAASYHSYYYATSKLNIIHLRLVWQLKWVSAIFLNRKNQSMRLLQDVAIRDS